jgi:hypothetical protein
MVFYGVCTVTGNCANLETREQYAVAEPVNERHPKVTQS